MNKQKSFTLIELLVVIVIIGILAGVIMISTSSSIDKANIAKLKVFSESIKNNLTLNLVSEWNFNDSSSPYKDSWGNNSCSLVSFTGITPPEIRSNDCVSENCLYFYNDVDYNVEADYFNCGSLPESTIVWTQELWIKSSTNGRMIMTIGNACVYADAGIAWAGNTWYPGIGSIYDNKWHHLIFTYSGTNLINGNNIFAYVDGLLKAQGNKMWSAVISPIRIGRGYGWTIAYSYRGFVDEMKIYNNYLNQSQIKQNYIAGLNSMLSNGSISKKEYNERINTLAYEQE